MEDKILGFQFEPMSAKPTRPSYKDGSDQGEPQISYRRCSVKVFLEVSQNSQENTCARVSFLIKSQARTWHRCFPVKFAKILRTSFLQNTSGWLLLEPKTQHNRLSSQKWCNCQNCELECVCCHEIPEVKAFNLKGKARLSWNTANLDLQKQSFANVFQNRCS